jgi:exonuclease SbcC
VADAADALKTAQQQLAAFNNQQAAFKKEQTEFEQTFKNIAEEFEFARLGRRFGEERRKLEDGKPCPLCGALHHPEADKAQDESYFDTTKHKFDEAQQKKDDIMRRLREIELRIGDTDKLIGEKQSFVDGNKALLAELEGKHETEVIGKAIEDAEKRLRDFSILQSSRIAVAENVREMTARFGDVDKDVAMNDSRKRSIADAEADKKTKVQLRAQSQAQLDTLTLQRKALFGDKNADAEEAATNKELKLAQATKEEARKRAEQAERLQIQNGKDIARTLNELGMLSAKLNADYENAVAAAVNLQNMSDDEDVTTLYGRFIDEAAALDRQPNTLERVQRQLTALITGEAARLGSVRQILKANAESRQTVKSLRTQEKAFKQTLQKWEKLSALIGSASGDKFSRMAQSFTFDALLRYANISLQRMSDR